MKVAPERQRPVCLVFDQKTRRTVLKRRIDLQMVRSQGNHASKVRAQAESKSCGSSNGTYFISKKVLLRFFPQCS